MDNWATLAVAVGITCVASQAATQPNLTLTTPTGRTSVVHASLAWTDHDQGEGVRGLHDFGPGRAMYFPLHPHRQVTVYMDGVNIDLDVAFIRNGRIIALRHATACPTQSSPASCPITTSPGTIDAVLELPHTPGHTVLHASRVTTYALNTK